MYFAENHNLRYISLTHKNIVLHTSFNCLGTKFSLSYPPKGPRHLFTHSFVSTDTHSACSAMYYHVLNLIYLPLVFTISIQLLPISALPLSSSLIYNFSRDNGSSNNNTTSTNGTDAITTNSTSGGNNTSSQRYVFAHHMVGNTAPYTIDDWTEDIKLASEAGIDAFALNIGTDSWETDQVKNAYDAAEKSGTSFKMFISLDMTYVPFRPMSITRTRGIISKLMHLAFNYIA